MTLTLIQAQQRYINRKNSCHAGHRNRVARSAAKELCAWARQHGYQAQQVLKDANDMADLEYSAQE